MPIAALMPYLADTPEDLDVDLGAINEALNRPDRENERVEIVDPLAAIDLSKSGRLVALLDTLIIEVFAASPVSAREALVGHPTLAALTEELASGDLSKIISDLDDRGFIVGYDRNTREMTIGFTRRHPITDQRSAYRPRASDSKTKRLLDMANGIDRYTIGEPPVMTGEVTQETVYYITIVIP